MQLASNFSKKLSVYSLLLLLIFFSSMLASFMDFSAHAQEPYYYVYSELNQVYGFQGQTLSITTYTNYTGYNLKIIDSNDVIVYDQNGLANTTVSRTITDSMLAGVYQVVSRSPSETNRQLFTVLNVTHWSQVSFPHVVNHRGLTYTFFSNWSFRVANSESMLINMAKLGSWADQYDLNVKAYANDMNFLVRLRNSTRGIFLDLTFSFIHKGCKLIVNGTLDEPKTFTFQARASKLRSIFHSVRRGDIVFDWSDLRGKHFYSYDQASHTVTINIPASFILDPLIFEAYHESDDFSEFSGTSVGGGGAIQTVDVADSGFGNGNYHACGNLTVGDGKAYAYQTIAASTDTFAQLIWEFDDHLPDAGKYVGIIEIGQAAQWNCEVRVHKIVGTLYLCIRYRDGAGLTEQHKAYAFSIGVTYIFELRYLVDAADGNATVWVNGVKELSYAGIDSNDNGDTTQVRFGVGWYSDDDNTHFYWDDCIINDAYIGVNIAPTNDSCTITDMDDADNLYAQKQDYTIDYDVTDLNGFANIDYAEARLKQGAATRTIFRYDEDTDTFSIESGDAEFELNLGSCSATESGNYINITFKFSVEWDATEEADVDIECYVIDEASESDTDTMQTDYVDIITNLVTASIECTDPNNPDRVNIGDSVTIDFTVRYANNPASGTASDDYPPDAEFTSISIYDSANNNEGTDASIVNGGGSVTFSAPASVGSDTYNLYINMVDADYTDGEETTTETIITDVVMVSLSLNDGRDDIGDTIYVNLNATYGFDMTSVVDGIIKLNGTNMNYQSGNWWQLGVSQGSVDQWVYIVTSISGNTYNITVIGTIDFDGVNDYVTFPDSASLNVTNTFTIAFAVSFNTMAQGQNFPVFFSKEGGVRTGYIVSFNNSTKVVACELYEGGVRVAIVTGTKNDWVADTMYFFTFTFDVNGGSDNFNFYVDGVLEKAVTDPSNWTNYAGSLSIAARGSGNDFDGEILSAYLYDRELSPREVYELYQGYISSVGLVFQVNPSSWNVTSSIWSDLSGENNDGVITAATVQMGAFTDGFVAPIWDRVNMTMYATNTNCTANELIQIYWQIHREFDDSIVKDYSVFLARNSSNWGIQYTDDSLAPTDSLATGLYTYNCNGTILDNLYDLTAYVHNPITVYWNMTEADGGMPAASETGGALPVGMLLGVGFGIFIFAPIFAIMIFKQQRTERY